MKCCVGVSIEAVLQVVNKYYTVVNCERIKKLLFRTVVLLLSECMGYKINNKMFI